MQQKSMFFGISSGRSENFVWTFVGAFKKIRLTFRREVRQIRRAPSKISSGISFGISSGPSQNFVGRLLKFRSEFFGALPKFRRAPSKITFGISSGSSQNFMGTPFEISFGQLVGALKNTSPRTLRIFDFWGWGAKLGSKTSVVFFVNLGLGIPCSHKSCVGWCAQSGVKGFYALGHLRGSPSWPYEPCNILNDLLDHAQ